MNNKRRDSTKVQSTSDNLSSSISREYLNCNSLLKQSTTGYLGQKTLNGNSSKSSRPTFLFSFLSSNNVQESKKSQKSHTSLKLSEVIASKTTGVVLENRKISVVEKFVTEIDELPSRYLGIETLFLSNNCIVSLKNIGQWKNLRVLSMANNNIESLSELDHLAGLLSLRVLNLEFNPVAQLPYYRTHVLYRLPELQTLDNKDVQSPELRKTESILKKDETFLSMLFHNECITAKLATGLKQIKDDQNHRLRMIQKLKQLNLKHVSRLDSKSILDLWDMKDVYSEKDRPYVYHMIRCEVKKIYNIRMFGGGTIKELSPSFITAKAPSSKADQWEVSYNEALLLQQQVIAKLLYQLEIENEKTFKLIYQSDMLLDQLIDDDLKSLPNRDRLVSEFRQTVDSLVNDLKRKYTSGRISIPQEHQEDFSVTSLQDSQSIYNWEPITADMLNTPPTNKNTHKSKENRDPTNAPPSRSGTSTSMNEYSLNVQNSISHRTTLVHSLPPQQPDPLTPVKNTRKITTSGASKKIPATNRPVSTSSRTVEKENVQLEKLTVLEQQLQGRIELEHELRQLNSELREKLEKYKNQNHENNAKALEERSILATELQSLKEKYLSSQKLLESKVYESMKLQKIIEEKERDNQEKRKQIIEFNRKQEILDEELAQIRSSHKKLEDLLHLAKSDILSVTHESDYIKQVASEYSKELQDLFSLEHQIEKAENFYKKRLLEKSFYTLIVGMREIKFQKVATQRISQRLKRKQVAQLFLQWKRKTKLSQLARKVRRTSRKSLLIRGLTGLSIHAERQKEIQLFCERRDFEFLKYSFNGWLVYHRKHIILSEIERKINQQVSWNFLKGVFNSWRSALHAKKEKEMEKSLQVEECKSNLILRKAFRAWQKFIYQIVYANIEKEKALRLYLDQRLAVRTLLFWKNVLQLRRKGRSDEVKAESKYNLGLISKIFRRWHWKASKKKKETQKWEKAVILHNQHMMKQFFDLLRSISYNQKRRKLSFLKAFNFYFTNLRRKAFDSLIMFHEHRTSKNKIENKADHKYTFMVFQRWVKAVEKNRSSRRLEFLADTVAMSHQKCIRSIHFNHWKQATEKRVKLAHLEQELKEKRSKSFVWGMFRKWMIRYLRSIRDELSNKSKESDIYEKELKKWNEKLSAANVENLQLIEQIHALTAEVSVLRTDTREKNEQLLVLHKTVEDSVIIESSLRSEINGYRDQISDYESEISRFKTLVVSREDQTEETMEKILELQNAKYRIQSLEVLLEEKNAEIGRLQKTISALELATGDVEEKLQSSFELSSSLRKLLDDKDSAHHIERSETEENRRNDLLAYETRVNEMAALISNLELKLKYAEEKNRKMNCEIQLLTRRNDDQFLSETSDQDTESRAKDDGTERISTGIPLGFDQSLRKMSSDDRELRELLFSQRVTNPTQRIAVPQIMKTNLEELKEHQKQILEEETQFEITKNYLLIKEANRYRELQKEVPFASILNRSRSVTKHPSFDTTHTNDDKINEGERDGKLQGPQTLQHQILKGSSDTSISSSTSIADLDKEIKKLQNEILDRLSKK